MKTEANHSVIGKPNGSLTKREYFAALAMQAIISKLPNEVRSRHEKEKEIRTARGAVDYADALIEELNKGK